MRTNRQSPILIAAIIFTLAAASSDAAETKSPAAPGNASGNARGTAEADAPENAEGAAPTAATVNDAAAAAATGATPSRAAIVRAAILLDRAQFSPGEIDGKWGTNIEAALRGFQTSRGLTASGKLDEPTWTALNADSAPVLVDYTVTEADAGGPFHPVPADMMEKAKLKELGYASAGEALGEKFHSSPQLLADLNPGRSLGRAGETLVVPNVESAQPLAKAAKVVVDESDATVSVVDGAGKTVAQFPATMGSEKDPLPIGEWKVTLVQANPKFHYNPDLFWDGKAAHSKATIAPGPNNPVGVVWIDLSKEHYGIHGSPEPSKIGHTESHGCIRVTNWSANALATAVDAGTPVVLQK